MVNAERLPSKSIAYESSFDRNPDVNPLEIKRNLETLLGERLNVLLSKNIYRIKNNLIYGENRDEPFINTIQRGIEYKRVLDGEQRVDRKREEAELDGFALIQDILCHPNTNIGTMVISVSPQGKEDSIYKHNFYDIFTLKKENGERFIEARRYSSALVKEEYRGKLELFYPSIYGNNVSVTDDYFLSHPVVISNGLLKNAEEAHAYFHKNHKYMEEEDFRQVGRSCLPFIERYIKSLCKNPTDVDTHSLILDAILNKADREVDIIRHSGDSDGNLSLEREIEFFGRQPVRQVSTGCGASGGFSKDSILRKGSSSVFSNPFSVADFGTDQEWFKCPKCKYQADGPIGDGPCPGCGLTKEEFVEGGGEVCD